MKFYTTNGDIKELSDFTEEEICPEVLGSKLENIKRFQGHPRALTVAEHCMLTSYLASENGAGLGLSVDCLLHDLGEAFLGDWNGAHKTDEQRVLEHQVDLALCAHGYRHSGMRYYKQYDTVAADEELGLIWPDKFHIIYERMPYEPGDWAREVRRLGAYKPPTRTEISTKLSRAQRTCVMNRK